ncbi:Jag N-terminal domain-containing protein [Vagococcus sp. PNs007]|uniref:RNA-binding protein KhpB n=1 Tax=Vagococcus proximus TaxID=2991417 RepID=A0ABT5X1H8_9ENTE|nr:RNA-binding cell elongation regulator Jag/EloR [Vagococcus proximus]MDF0479844.1 Jag N-terminal domain-containing protein [Vagococcus proximus]
MPKYEGVTVEQALEKGLSELELNKNQVSIKVLSMGKKGVLGNNQPAILEITPKVENSMTEKIIVENKEATLQPKIPKVYEGPTAEEALVIGLQDLNMSKNQVKIKILDLGKNGGIGKGKPAKVMLTPKEEITEDKVKVPNTTVGADRLVDNIFEGITPEEALSKGLKSLGLAKSEVKIKVLDLGKSAGLGKNKPARVKLTPKIILNEESKVDNNNFQEKNVNKEIKVRDSDNKGIFEAETVELALEKGLRTLNLTKSEAKIKVIELGKNPTIGKSKPAKVMVRRKSIDTKQQKGSLEVAKKNPNESVLKEIKQVTAVDKNKSSSTERIVKVFEGETVELALENGLKELGLRKEDVTVKVLNSAKKGIFGVGSKLARVVIKTKDVDSKLTEKIVPPVVEELPEVEEVPVVEELSEVEEVPVAEELPEVEEAPVAEELPEVEEAPVAEELPEVEEAPVVEELPEVEEAPVVEELPEVEEAPVVEELPEVEEAPVAEELPEVEEAPIAEELPKVETTPLRNLSKGKAVEALKEYLEAITKEMGYPATVVVIEGEHHVTFDLDCEKQGVLIGKHGKVLNSLQYMSEMYVNRISGKRMSVMINVGEYRRRREVTLNKLAVETAKKVNETNESISLDPMLSFERQQVRNALLDNDSITLRSEGHEPFRFVIVEPKEKN